MGRRWNQSVSGTQDGITIMRAGHLPRPYGDAVVTAGGVGGVGGGGNPSWAGSAGDTSTLLPPDDANAAGNYVRSLFTQALTTVT
ncbi:hypothetical protein E2C01_093754 [Portunus trituberculatus]|uniref:Uncharacterized protein n=1 Tax=Portunus trituberculatus TaxID=210409 RepID=A0A5B7JV15_PORTR|nr:hypothetical protein [Portunus trituberculatus]